MTSPAPESSTPKDRWSATHSITFGPAIWVNGKFFARVECDIEMCRISEANPVPEWRRLLSALIERMNQSEERRVQEGRMAIEKKIALYLAGDALGTLQAESHDWESLEIRANTTPYPEMAKDLYEIVTDEWREQIRKGANHD